MVSRVKACKNKQATKVHSDCTIVGHFNCERSCEEYYIYALNRDCTLIPRQILLGPMTSQALTAYPWP